jgi:hypothetical protein
LVVGSDLSVVKEKRGEELRLEAHASRAGALPRQRARHRRVLFGLLVVAGVAAASTILVLSVLDDPPARDDPGASAPVRAGTSAPTPAASTGRPAREAKPRGRPSSSAGARSASTSPAGAPSPPGEAPPGPGERLPSDDPRVATLASLLGVRAPATKETREEERRAGAAPGARAGEPRGRTASTPDGGAHLAAAAAVGADAPVSRSGANRDGGAPLVASAGDTGAPRAGPGQKEKEKDKDKDKDKLATAGEVTKKWAGLEKRPSQAEADLKRVARFASSGGATLKGRVVDAETGKPIDSAIVDVRLSDNFVEAESDSGGNFRIPGMLPGTHVTVWIIGREDLYVAESIGIPIPGEGESADAGVVRLVHGNEMAAHLEGWVGLFVTRRGRNNVVAAISPWTSAERAGIEVGDVLLSIDGNDMTGLGPRATNFLLRGPAGTTAHVTAKGRNGDLRHVELERIYR